MKKADDICKLAKKGVIHVGANTGQEAKDYANRYPVLWVEPLPEVFATLTENVAQYPNQRCLNRLITLENDKEVKFFTANHHCRSSIYAFTNHHYSDTRFIEKPSVLLTGVRMDKLIDDGEVDITMYDTLVTDVQGADYDVVVSFGEHIRAFQYIRCEVMFKPIYKGIQLAPALTKYLATKGFKLKARFPYGPKYGDYIYEKI